MSPNWGCPWEAISHVGWTLTTVNGCWGTFWSEGPARLLHRDVGKEHLGVAWDLKDALVMSQRQGKGGIWMI